MQPYGNETDEELTNEEEPDENEKEANQAVEDEMISKSNSLPQLNKRKTRLESMKEDSVGTFWMSMERNECFDSEATIFAVEVPKREHGLPEVIKAKEKEIENLEKYGTFVETIDEGKEKITSRWVITRKTKQDGQKEEIKARLVARIN